MGTLYEQKFYAIRANGGHLRFPFKPGPFTALIDIQEDVGEETLKRYARDLLGYGCVQAVCRGGEAAVLNDIFDELSEDGGLDGGDIVFTSMPVDDEPIRETMEYFVLPSGLAPTGLLMVIGDSGGFKSAIRHFADTAAELRKSLHEPVYVEEELVCFGLTQ